MKKIFTNLKNKIIALYHNLIVMYVVNKGALIRFLIIPSFWLIGLVVGLSSITHGFNNFNIDNVFWIGVAILSLSFISLFGVVSKLRNDYKIEQKASVEKSINSKDEKILKRLKRVEKINKKVQNQHAGKRHLENSKYN